MSKLLKLLELCNENDILEFDDVETLKQLYQLYRTSASTGRQLSDIIYDISSLETKVATLTSEVEYLSSLIRHASQYSDEIKSTPAGSAALENFKILLTLARDRI